MDPHIRPLISVIIPTRERADTLRYTIASALDNKNTDYEVVISDNASTDNTLHVSDMFADKRVRYFNTGERVSMCDNYEFALSNCRGEYIVIIGDDDAVIPGALDRLVAEVRLSSTPSIYMWPLHIYDWPVGGNSAKVAYLAPNQQSIEVNLKSKALRTMSLGGWRYYELPSPYHSLIPRQLLENIRLRTGRVFHSTQPDVFTAMALPAFADCAILLSSPVTFHGRSARSNGIGFVDRRAQPNIDRFIKEYGGYQFHCSLDRKTSGIANMIPDAILIAKEMFPEIYADVPFNYSAMWAYICRLGFAKHRQVITNRNNIKKLHQFSTTTFLGFSIIHQLLALRRRTLNIMMLFSRPKSVVPENIYDFAKVLGARYLDSLTP